MRIKNMMIMILIISAQIVYNYDELEFLREYVMIENDDSQKQKEFSNFLNSLLAINIGENILTKCKNPYVPDANSHEIFIAQYQKIAVSINSIINQGVPKEITGQKCEYNLSDPNVFTSAKSTELTSQSLLISLLYKTQFGKNFMGFLKCIGQDELKTLSSQLFVDEMFYIFGSDKKTIQFFESFCSVNNIFNRLKVNIDYKDTNAFIKLGTNLNLLLNDLVLHYKALVTGNA